jgi:hypothetical protein
LAEIRWRDKQSGRHFCKYVFISLFL